MKTSVSTQKSASMKMGKDSFNYLKRWFLLCSAFPEAWKMKKDSFKYWKRWIFVCFAFEGAWQVHVLHVLRLSCPFVLGDLERSMGLLLGVSVKLFVSSSNDIIFRNT